jgi:hypothetical protein
MTDACVIPEGIMERRLSASVTNERVQVKLAETLLDGQMTLPPQARGVILFPHGRGTSRGRSDGLLASKLCEAGLGTFLLDLLTTEEADLDARKAAFRFDTRLLAERLALATDWLAQEPATRNLALGYLATGYTASAALHAAAKRPDLVRAVVTHDAVADAAEKALPRVSAATLTIGGVNQAHAEQLGAEDKRFIQVPTLVAVHKPEEVARLAVEWFAKHLTADAVFATTGLSS